MVEDTNDMFCTFIFETEDNSQRVTRSVGTRKVSWGHGGSTTQSISGRPICVRWSISWRRFSILRVRYESGAGQTHWDEVEKYRTFSSLLITFVSEYENRNGSTLYDAKEVVPLLFLSTSAIQNISARCACYASTKDID